MAKVFKATIYITEAMMDNYESCDLRDSLEEMSDRYGLSLHIADIKESDEFEWADDLDINFTDATNEDFEKYINYGDRVKPMEGKVKKREGDDLNGSDS